MMFRKLYWVTERLENDGTSRVLGVYTSIPDLLRTGMGDDISRLRLTLVKLDSSQAPLGRWEPPTFEGLAEQMEAYVRTEEFSREHLDDLIRALQTRVLAA